MSKTVDIQKLKVEIRNALNQQNANIVSHAEAIGGSAHLAVGLLTAWGKDKQFTVALLGYIQGYTEAKGVITDQDFDLFNVSTEVVKEFVIEHKSSLTGGRSSRSELPEELIELLQILKSATRH